jgi:hypothetical protein
VNLGITFSHPQVVRNAIYDLNNIFFRKIKYDNLILICNRKTVESVNFILKSLPDTERKKISVIEINLDLHKNIKYRVLTFICKAHVHSKFAIAKFFRSYSKKEISILNLIIKLFCYLVTYKNKHSAQLLRKVNLNFFKSNKVLYEIHTLANCDLFLTLSLTDDLDIAVTAFGNLNNIKTIGTVRSWDNLTSHGLIRVIPNYFYCHSSTMLNDLEKFQYLISDKSTIVQGHSYWINFYEIDKLRTKSVHGTQNRIKRILYGAMGSYNNPTEELFLTNFIELLAQFNDIKLTVLIHPAFPLKETFTSDFKNKVTFYSFSFESLNEVKSYSDYLNFLTEFDLVVSSGSTLLLDACLIDQNVCHLSIEPSEINYWESINRFLDFREYYRNFIAISQIPVCHSQADFLKILNGDSKYNNINHRLTSDLILGQRNSISIPDLINEII